MCSTFDSTLVLFAGKEEMPKMEKIETAILLAAQNGITDTVKKILKEIPMAINVKSEGNNIVFLAKKNMQPLLALQSVSLNFNIILTRNMRMKILLE